MTIVGGVFFFLLTAWQTSLEFRFNWLKKSGEDIETRTGKLITDLKVDTGNLITDLKDELAARDVARGKVNDDRHADNQAANATNARAIETRNSQDIVERHRIVDALDRISTRLAMIPDRTEVQQTIALALANRSHGTD